MTPLLTVSKPAIPNLWEFPDYRVYGNVIFVQTHVMYDDGQSVAVEVRPGSAGVWHVTDGKGALHVLQEHLIEPNMSTAARIAQSITEATSVSYEKGAWSMANNSFDQVSVAIALVANASARWAHEIFKRDRGEDLESLDERILEGVLRHFGEAHVTKSGHILGESTREYTFPAIVRLGDKRFAAFASATPYGASINATYTKAMDVRAGSQRPAILAVVYSPSPKWTSSDVSLLRGACDEVVEFGPSFDRRLQQIKEAA